MFTKKSIEEKLRLVLDPELGINVVDLGLIYHYTADSKNNIDITMTLTFPGCPLGSTIKQEINEKVGSLPGVGKINLQITFNPPWDLSKISAEARAELGMV